MSWLSEFTINAQQSKKQCGIGLSIGKQNNEIESRNRPMHIWLTDF